VGCDSVRSGKSYYFRINTLPPLLEYKSVVYGIEAASSKMFATSYQTTRWYKPGYGSMRLLSVEYLAFCMNKTCHGLVDPEDAGAVIIANVVSNYTMT